MSQKRMAVSLTVLETQRQRWTGAFTPSPSAGIRVKMIKKSQQLVLLN